MSIKEQLEKGDNKAKGAKIDEEKLWHFAIVLFVSFWEMTQKVENSFKRLNYSLAPDITISLPFYEWSFMWNVCENISTEKQRASVLHAPNNEANLQEVLEATMKVFINRKTQNVVGKVVTTTRVYNMLSQHKSLHCARNKN